MGNGGGGGGMERGGGGGMERGGGGGGCADKNDDCFGFKKSSSSASVKSEKSISFTLIGCFKTSASYSNQLESLP